MNWLEQVTATSAVRAINHVLNMNAWAKAKLQPHAGKVVLLQLPLGAATLRVAGDGLFETAPAGDEQGAVLRLHPSAAQWTRFFAGNRAAAREFAKDGDAALAADLLFVAEHAEWDVEEDLSRVVGDIAAHRIATTSRAAMDWQRKARENFAANVGEYLSEERRLVVARAEFESFAKDVAALREQVEQLEARIARLAS